ncbi:MAG: TatD family deoxyribonuclease [Actinobacteria bacterium]|nr:MAG: TatD family deoxyribonuclease [Actinomycetota bacterium]
MPALVDTHAHLDLLLEEGLPVTEALAGARKAGVAKIMTIGIDLPSSAAAVRLAEEHEEVFAAVGVHPNSADGYDSGVEKELRALGASPKVVAIGEIGLDYYRDRSPRDRQRAAFRRQLELAVELSLPVCVHSREASEDVLRVLGTLRPRPAGILMHCFSGDIRLAGKMLELGCHIALAGPVTFRNATTTAEVARSIPLDRLLLETDSPFLAPHPHRGKRNEPALLPLVAQRVADLREISLDEVAEATTANANKLFGLDRR